jgi:hypothetical protein
MLDDVTLVMWIGDGLMLSVARQPARYVVAMLGNATIGMRIDDGLMRLANGRIGMLKVTRLGDAMVETRIGGGILRLAFMQRVMHRAMVKVREERRGRQPRTPRAEGREGGPPRQGTRLWVRPCVHQKSHEAQSGRRANSGRAQNQSEAEGTPAWSPIQLTAQTQADIF